MKKVILLISLSLFSGLFILAAGQDSGAVLKIQTSAQCEMCKESLEKTMAYEKGVISSNLDLKTKVLEVKYKSGKTDADKIRKAISASGYDADDVKADPKAYSKLPTCCKKPEDRKK